MLSGVFLCVISHLFLFIFICRGWYLRKWSVHILTASLKRYLEPWIVHLHVPESLHAWGREPAFWPLFYFWNGLFICVCYNIPVPPTCFWRSIIQRVACTKRGFERREGGDLTPLLSSLLHTLGSNGTNVTPISSFFFWTCQNIVVAIATLPTVRVHALLKHCIFFLLAQSANYSILYKPCVRCHTASFAPQVGVASWRCRTAFVALWVRVACCFWLYETKYRQRGPGVRQGGL